MSRSYPERPIVGVGVVVWRDDRVLLVKRGRPPRAGQWSLPGGAQNLGETLVEAAAREVMEETSLAVQQPRLVTVLDMVERDDAGGVRYHYTLIDFTAEAPVGLPVAGDDAAGLAWFSLAEIGQMPIWHETRRIIEMAAELR